MPWKVADSLSISYGIVPVLPVPTGTRGSSPNMEDTGITYKTCEDSLHSYTMVDWHASIQAVQQSDRDSEYAKYVEYVEYTEYVEDDLVFIGTKDFKINFWNTVRFLYINMILMHGYESRRQYSKHNVGHDASPASLPSKDSFRQIW